LVLDAALLYYYTGDESFIPSIANRIDTWFLDTSTRMNPNLNFGQVIPPSNIGRAEGVIDTHVLVDLVEGVQILSKSSRFPLDTYKGLKNWFSEYYNWLNNSSIGKDASKRVNNIATAYYLQLSSYCMFIGRKGDFSSRIVPKLKFLISQQVDENGKQINELGRANSLSYCLTNMQFWQKIIKISRNNNIDLWNYSNNGRGLKKTYYWMVTSLDGNSWKYSQKADLDLKRSKIELEMRFNSFLPKKTKDLISYTKNNTLNPLITLTE